MTKLNLNIRGLTQITETLKLEDRENPVKRSGSGQQKIVHFIEVM